MKTTTSLPWRTIDRTWPRATCTGPFFSILLVAGSLACGSTAAPSGSDPGSAAAGGGNSGAQLGGGTAESAGRACRSDADCGAGSTCAVTGTGEFRSGTCSAPAAGGPSSAPGPDKPASTPRSGQCDAWAATAAAYTADASAVVDAVQSAWASRPPLVATDMTDEGLPSWVEVPASSGHDRNELFGPLMYGWVADSVHSVRGGWGGSAVVSRTLDALHNTGGGSNLYAPPKGGTLVGGDWESDGGGSNTYYAVQIRSMRGINGANTIVNSHVGDWLGGIWLMAGTTVATMRESPAVGGMGEEPPRGVILKSDVGSIDAPTGLLICNSHVGTLTVRAGAQSRITLVNSTMDSLTGDGGGEVTVIGSTITNNTSNAKID